MGLFRKNEETGLIRKKPNERDVVISVPDIKEYLVKEYNRVNDLKLINEGLEQQLQEANEVKLKYEATLVTLDEYSKRLERAEREISSWRESYRRAQQDVKSANDEVNSYKIKFTNAAITKEEIEKEIVEEVKADIISKINECKGNLSKKAVCDLIRSYIKERKI